MKIWHIMMLKLILYSVQRENTRRPNKNRFFAHPHVTLYHSGTGAAACAESACSLAGWREMQKMAKIFKIPAQNILDEY